MRGGRGIRIRYLAMREVSTAWLDQLSPSSLPLSDSATFFGDYAQSARPTVRPLSSFVYFAGLRSPLIEALLIEESVHPKGAPYRPAPFRLTLPPLRAGNACVVEFLSHSLREALSEPSTGVRTSSLYF